jgi:hypothetical protein
MTPWRSPGAAYHLLVQVLDEWSHLDEHGTSDAPHILDHDHVGTSVEEPFSLDDRPFSIPAAFGHKFLGGIGCHFIPCS